MSGQDTLIERLRAHSCGCGGPCGQQTPSYIAEAAAEIDSLRSRCETLERENARLEIDVRDYRQFSIDYAVERDKATAAESRLAMAEAALGAMADLAQDATAGLRYVQDHHGKLYGIGFDRVFEKEAKAADSFRAARSLSHGEDKADG